MIALEDEGWIKVESCLPDTNKKIRLHTGDYEYIGKVDEYGEVWISLDLSEEEEYHSNLGDGYITHWKLIN